MLKKVDKLILQSFIGPFILTFFIVVFILLMQFLITYFDELAGKGLDIKIYIQLLFYFSFNMVPLACPLAVLLASLITFGNLGEYFELTALKSAGISLLRVIQPIFLFVVILSISIFLINSYFIPKTNLKAYNLLYDLRHKKPALNLKQGVFYNGIPGYSIKVNQKLSDNKTLEGIIIYNHKKGIGNTEIIIARSGKMYTIDNSKYLVIELFDGNHYTEEPPDDPKYTISKFYRTNFAINKIVLDITSFQLHRTKEDFFSENKTIKTIGQLTQEINTMEVKLCKIKEANIKKLFNHFHKLDSIDLESSQHIFQKLSSKVYLNDNLNIIQYKAQINEENRIFHILPIQKIPYIKKKLKNDHVFTMSNLLKTVCKAGLQIKNLQNSLTQHIQKVEELHKKKIDYTIEIYKKLSLSVSCLILLLIGAPLGAIIKKGGLGMPIIISIGFFVIYYILMMVGEDFTKAYIVSIFLGIGLPNIVLFPVGIFLLTQAKNDTRILEANFYWRLLKSIKKLYIKNN